MKRLLPIGLLTLMLVGCAGTNNNTQGPYGYGYGSNSSSSNAALSQTQINTQVQNQLEQAANSAQASLQELAAIEKLQAQNNVSIPLSDVDDPALNQMISIKWYGPIEPLLAQIASTTGYQFQVYGKPPSLPVLVNVDTTTQPSSAINIIRNVDLQAGLKVAILVFTDQKIISLRYSGS